MRKSSRYQGGGYLISSLGVVVLAIPALQAAAVDENLVGWLVGGILLSIAGMALRWRGHRLEVQRKEIRVRHSTKTEEEGWQAD